MKYYELNELRSRGTPDFPIEFYIIDSTHPRYIMPFHWHSEFEIIRVEEGEIKINAGEEQYVAYAGDVILLNGGLIHGGTPKDCVYHCVVLDMTMLLGRGVSAWQYDIQQLTDNYGIKIRNFFPKSDKEPNKTVDRLFSVLRDKPEGYHLMTLGALYSIFGYLYEENLVQSGELRIKERYNGASKMKVVLGFIENNYEDSITLDDMAQAAGMSPKYFCQFFKKFTHRSPIEYLNMYRVDSACRILRVKGCSVTEAAFSCGFNDLSYFVKTFKRYKGVTPKQYKLKFDVIMG